MKPYTHEPRSKLSGRRYLFVTVEAVELEWWCSPTEIHNSSTTKSRVAGSGDSSDEARFRHFAATSLMMTNQIGVARTILANLPITRHSQNRGRPLLGYVPLAPHRAYRVRRDR